MSRKLKLCLYSECLKSGLARVFGTKLDHFQKNKIKWSIYIKRPKSEHSDFGAFGNRSVVKQFGFKRFGLVLSVLFLAVS